VDKIPCNAAGRPADAHDPANQLTHDAAQAAADALGAPYGVGFAFSHRDPFFFIDVDGAVADGQWTPEARDLLQRFNGASVSMSHSGTGIHIIGSGVAPSPRRTKPVDGSFDALFTEARFVALTGRHVCGDASTVHTPALEELVARLLPAAPQDGQGADEWRDTPVRDGVGVESDRELLERAQRTQGAGVFSGRATFAQLWTADSDALGTSYPDPSGHRDYDASKADAALAQHLAFWTGGNHTRIRTLMEWSGLRREKWERADYLRRTISRACSMQKEYYTPPAEATESTPAPGSFMSPQAQADYFRGHVYVLSDHRIFTPTGDLLRPEQYKAMYGGYTFAMDAQAERTTRNAWEAFTESQCIRWPKVHGLVFRPTLAAGSIVELHGRQYVNTYIPVTTARQVGDVEPFLAHVRKLLPDPGDQDILLSYMAAVVQNPGLKFQWAPVLQGTDGNGKSILYHVLARAIGAQYCHQLDPLDLQNTFTAWIERKLLVCVEEIRTAGRHEVADRLKPLITNSRVPVQSKGVDQRTGDNCANFIMFSNYKDAVMKTRSDRRYCVFYTAQQAVEDLERDGLTGAYFRGLYDWLDGPGGDMVTEYLSTRPVNVDVLGRSPSSSSTGEALRESLGVAEQIILEAVDLGEPGFRKGLISSRAASMALAAAGRKLGPRAMADVLATLGYELHPALAEGKIQVQGQRFKLYARREGPAWHLDATAVRGVYEKAQVVAS
jgi:hypothetical protein